MALLLLTTLRIRTLVPSEVLKIALALGNHQTLSTAIILYCLHLNINLGRSSWRASLVNNCTTVTVTESSHFHSAICICDQAATYDSM